MTVSVAQLPPNDNQPLQIQSQNSAEKSALARETALIVAAYIGKNAVALDQIGEIIQSVHQSLKKEFGGLAAHPSQEPAIPVHQSIQGDYLVCLEDGKKMRMLKRYLRTNYNMTPEEYKAKWNLPAAYPMTAPGYSQRRSDFAKQFGLGKQRNSDIKAA